MYFESQNEAGQSFGGRLRAGLVLNPISVPFLFGSSVIYGVSFYNST